jgi:predicted amidophosphoribosyltransferase
MSRFLIFFLAGLAGAWVADTKGRNRFLWFVLCLFFPPLLFLLLFLPMKVSGGRTKQCPSCGRVVPAKETVCRYCRKELPIEMVQCPSCGSFVPDKGHCIQCHRELKQRQ